ncbi:MAG: hypothetical protein WCF67_13855 [Chitinophagaceae bacterium]
MPVVTKLKPNQCAFRIGEKNIPHTPPSVSIKKVSGSPKIYKFTFTIQFKAQLENLGASEIPLPEGSFAVFNIERDQPLRSSSLKVYFNAISNAAGDDYVLATSVDSEYFPGSKGNHGS